MFSRLFKIIRKYLILYPLRKIFLGALKSPLKPFRVIRDERRLVKLLESEFKQDKNQIKEIIEEFNDDLEIHERIGHCKDYIYERDLEPGAMSEEAALIYSLVRLKCPSTVVEVGVANGFSTFVILKSLNRNKKGNLISVDKTVNESDPESHRINSTLVPSSKEAGWVAPESLKDRWELIQGEIEENLHLLAEKVDSPEILVYDADLKYLSQTVQSIFDEDQNFILVVDGVNKDYNKKEFDRFMKENPDINVKKYKKVAIGVRR